MLGLPRLLVTSLASSRYASRGGAPGQEFSSFGRSLGLKALLRGERAGLRMILAPVSITRYWEFPFVRRHLSPNPGRCLDISSPRLFSYYVASRMRPNSVRMLNPDRVDAAVTERIARRCGIDLQVEVAPVSAMNPDTERFNSIWSISVIEHIGEDGDIDAMRRMYGALAPGGRLLVTVPVDRNSWDEYRPTDTYALGAPRGPDGWFFQRWYDQAAIASRLLDPIDAGGAQLEWFGEREPGRFSTYIDAWLQGGWRTTVEDPREITDWYAPYRTWREMPGQGVCGIAITKPETMS